MRGRSEYTTLSKKKKIKLIITVLINSIINMKNKLLKMSISVFITHKESDLRSGASTISIRKNAIIIASIFIH